MECFSSRKEGEGDLKLCWLPTKLTGGCDKQQGVFCRGFFWVKFGGGRIGGEGGVFVAGSFAGFGQRVRIGVWPGR